MRHILPVLALGSLLCTSCVTPLPPTSTGAQIPTGTGADLQARNVDLFSNIATLNSTGEEVVYTNDGSRGYLARPAKPGTYPAVVMIHEWWGLNSHIKDMARILADEGYVVLAVDLYSGVVATDPKMAGEKAGGVRSNPTPALANMRAAVDFLRARSDVQGEKIASLGWCFGGQQSLLLALGSSDLAATVIYYGNLVTEAEKLRTISWPVLGVFGETDTSVTVDSVRAFEAGLKEAGVQHAIHIYPGVGHAFANPSGQRYAPMETMDAWKKTLDFLRLSLGS